MRFRGDQSAIRGSIAPVVTPFTADGELDLDGLRSLIRWPLESGSHGISLGGSTGEPSAQTTDERISAMAEATELIADAASGGSMGRGLPAVMGIQLARRADRIVAVSGDGSFWMVAQDLETATGEDHE